MASEREYLKERLENIRQHMSQHSPYEVDAGGNFHLAYAPIPQRDVPLELEGQLIEKLLKEVAEGKIQVALASWYKQLYARWSEHCEYYRDMKMAYNEWLNLPRWQRLEKPEPIRPPDLHIRDASGNFWFVDQPLLDVLLDLQKRLAMWLSES